MKYAAQQGELKTVNQAKRQLLEIEMQEIKAQVIARQVEADSHLTKPFALLVLLGEIIITGVTIFQILYMFINPESFDLKQLISLMLGIWIAGLMFLRADGFVRLQRRRQQLRMITDKISGDKAAAEKVLNCL